METFFSENRIRVDSAVYEAFQDPFEWGPGVQDHYAIHYIKKGRGFFENAGKKYFLKEGQCFLLQPGVLVHYYPDPLEPWEYAWIGFSGHDCKKLLAQTSAFYPGPVSESAEKEIEPFFRNMADDFSQDSLSGDLKNISHLLLIFSYFIEKFPASGSKDSRDYAMFRAAELIEKNYRHQTLNVDLLSNAMKMNRTSLYRHFVKEFHTSPKEYITAVRISKAKELLKNSAFSIKNIAYSVGFSDQLYFAKVFKEKAGCTPTEYRNHRT